MASTIKPKEPTKEQKEAVVALVLRGHSWHRAVCDVLGVYGVKLRAAVYQAKCDPVIQAMLDQRPEEFAATRAQGIDRALSEIEEAADLARDQGDPRALLAAIAQKTALLGLDDRAPNDELARSWERMNDEQKLSFLDGRMKRLDDLRERLQKRGLTVIEGTASKAS